MQRLAFFALFAVLSSCSFSHFQVAQRVVELPKDNPNTSPATADDICRQLANGDLYAKLRARFPQLTNQQLASVFFRPNVGYFSQTGKITFIITGINYQEGALAVADANSVADYLQSLVREAVSARFGSPPSPP